MHFNYCVGGEKIQLMKEYGVWYNDLAPDVTKEIIRENLHFMPEHHIYSHETY
jgi:(2Fe-2S) ferredoxin